VIFVDSSVWVDYFNGQINASTDLLDQLLCVEPLITGDIVLAEVLQGFRSDRDYKIALKLLTSLNIQNVLSKDLAIKSAENFRNLRKRGITIRKTIDSIIATFCIHNQLVLLHTDRDFDPFEEHLGLQVFN
jgi:predicted nucleic acid-binding protein